MARRLVVGAVLGGCALVVSGCGSSEDSEGSGGSGDPAKIPVVASTNVYGDIARQVAGDKAEITSIISDPGQDPHSYEASTQNKLRLSKARIVIENGGGYDGFIDDLLKTSGDSKAEVINAVKVSGKTAPAGEELNEHVWYDLPTAARLADRIATALGGADPAGSDTYTRNAAAFKARLKPLEARTAAVKSAHGGAAVAVTEPVPGHLLAAAGLEDRTPGEFSEAIEEGDDVPPAALQETLALFTGKKVEALIYNRQTSGPQTTKVEQAARAAGIPAVPVTETLPAGKDYVTWMADNINALQGALAR